jgi:hypothetical protein
MTRAVAAEKISLRIFFDTLVTGLAPTPDKEISVNCNQQTKENKRVSHFYSCSSARLDAASFALAEEKKLIT